MNWIRILPYLFVWNCPPLIFGGEPVPRSIKCLSTGTFSCLTNGRFEDPFDPTCSKYYLCATYEVELVTVRLACPEGMFYDPTEERCSSQYACICDSNATVTTKAPPTTNPWCSECSKCLTTEESQSTVVSLSTSSPGYPTTGDTTLVTGGGNLTTPGPTWQPTISDTTVATKGDNFTSTIPPNSDTTIATQENTSTRTVTPTGQPTNSDRTSVSQGGDLTTLGPSWQPTYSDTTPVTQEDTSSSTVTSSGQPTNSDRTSVSQGDNLTTLGPSWHPTNSDTTPVTQENPSSSTVTPSGHSTNSDRTSVSQEGNLTTLGPSWHPTNSDTTPVTQEDTSSSTVTPSGQPTSSDRTSVSQGGNLTTLGPSWHPTNSDTTPVPQEDTSSSTVTPSGQSTNSDTTAVSHGENFTTSIPTNNTSIPTQGDNSTSTVSPSGQPTTSDATIFTQGTDSTTQPATSTTAHITPTTLTSDPCGTQETFTCSENGRFTNPADRSCSSYYYCIKLRDGNFTSAFYVCPPDSYFNPVSQGCDTGYVCPCQTVPTTTSLSQSSTAVPTTSQPSEGTTGLPPPAYCDSVGSNSFTCFANGRFINPNDASCLSYYYCYELSSSWYKSVLYECAAGSLFNNATGACEAGYQCPCNDLLTTETTVAPTSEAPTITPSACPVNEALTPFNCTENGRFSNPNDSSCSSYYYCYKLRSGSFSQMLYTCPSGSLFNPESQGCDTQYSCPCGTTTEVTSTPTTIEPCDYSPSNPTFVCEQNGRYPSPNDTSCASYYFCYKLSSGSFSQTLYTCPTGSLFNPDLGGCDAQFRCPCSSSATTTTAAAPTETSTSSALETTTTTSTCTADVSTVTFTCSENGRFLNPADLYCESYIYCYKLSSGSFVQQTYTCPSGTFFSPASQGCSSDNTCRCQQS
ncbi:mucin-2-like [Cylas formicarius]|uniref:mucin-2-like n=1 Tax=Cylas formicarius TaxID=197179 RepID=UPI0029587102|nr:mucin-2-like [Cylas formicarius]